MVPFSSSQMSTTTCTPTVGHPFCLIPKRSAVATPGRIARVVFDCFSPRSLAIFYEALLGPSVRLIDTPQRVEVDSDERETVVLAFQHVRHIPPTWPDPAYPQQLHVDFSFGESHGERIRLHAERLGAVRLPYLGGGFVYADPAGHPFCLGE
jgi:hypothetical protein